MRAALTRAPLGKRTVAARAGTLIYCLPWVIIARLTEDNRFLRAISAPRGSFSRAFTPFAIQSVSRFGGAATGVAWNGC